MGGEGEGEYVVSSLLNSFLVGVETMVKGMRRGEREEKTAERDTIFVLYPADLGERRQHAVILDESARC